MENGLEKCVSHYIPSLLSKKFVTYPCTLAANCRVTSETLVEEATWVFQGREDSVTSKYKEKKENDQ